MTESRLDAARRRHKEKTHQCPCGCERDVPDRFFACGPGWHRLPRDLQRPIVGNRRGTEEHWEAMADAIQWYAEQDDGR